VDWYLVHLPVELGKAVRIRALVVKGRVRGRTTLSPAQDLGLPGATVFSLFSVSAEAPGAAPGSLLLMPATVASSRQVGPALEEVAFTRDEMANMAGWWSARWKAASARPGPGTSGRWRSRPAAARPRRCRPIPTRSWFTRSVRRFSRTGFPLLPRKLPASVEVVLNQGTVEGDRIRTHRSAVSCAPGGGGRAGLRPA
jgi:hypothetical protein